MAKDPRAILNEFMEGLGAVGEIDSERVQSFLGFMDVVEKPGALDRKTKELISLAISVYAHCEYCIVYHINEALKAGASRGELMEAAFVAGLMGGGPAMAYSCTLLKDAINTFAPDYEK